MISVSLKAHHVLADMSGLIGFDQKLQDPPVQLADRQKRHEYGTLGFGLTEGARVEGYGVRHSADLKRKN